MRIRILTGFMALLSLTTAPALADDWVATKLRGTVLALEDGAWQELGRGDVVSDNRVIRTLRGGRVTFTRGAEVIDLGGDTQVRIYDRAGRKFTTVMQDFGTVSIEAEVQAVEHFSVATPQLAAVVKGTRFTVRSGQHDAEVTVERGRVAVRDNDTRQSTTVLAGQSAGTSDGGAPLTVAGSGALPVIRNADGTVVDPRKAAEQAVAVAARNAALADGLSPKEAEKAAREAAKEARKGSSDAGLSPKEAEKAAKDAARDAALASGASPKEAEKAAREAGKEAREEAREAAKEAKEERSESRGSDSSGNSDSGKGGGGNGNGNSGSGGGTSVGASDSSGNSGGGGDSSGSSNSGGGGGDSGSSGDSGNSGNGGGGGNGHGKKD